jgi:HEPN superfamily AbiU2-like protein
VSWLFGEQGDDVTQEYDRRHVVEEFGKFCWQLKIEFNLFCSLFDRGLERIELLQRTAPYLFGEISNVLRHQVILGFCRVTDPAGSGKRINLTSNFIAEKLPWPANVRTKLGKTNEELMAFRKFVLPARSKRIAHADLQAQINRQPLGAYPVGADDQFFRDLEKFLNTAFREITGGAFLLSAGPRTDTHRLIEALRKAELFDERERHVDKE